jgi:hypothetical protein
MVSRSPWWHRGVLDGVLGGRPQHAKNHSVYERRTDGSLFLVIFLDTQPSVRRFWRSETQKAGKRNTRRWRSSSNVPFAMNTRPIQVIEGSNAVITYTRLLWTQWYLTLLCIRYSEVLTLTTCYADAVLEAGKEATDGQTRTVQFYERWREKIVSKNQNWPKSKLEDDEDTVGARSYQAIDIHPTVAVYSTFRHIGAHSPPFGIYCTVGIVRCDNILA